MVEKNLAQQYNEILGTVDIGGMLRIGRMGKSRREPYPLYMNNEPSPRYKLYTNTFSDGSVYRSWLTNTEVVIEVTGLEISRTSFRDKV